MQASAEDWKVDAQRLDSKRGAMRGWKCGQSAKSHLQGVGRKPVPIRIPDSYNRGQRRLFGLASGFVVFLLGQSVASAASYQQQNGTVIDPIQDIFIQTHDYVGPDLQPGVDLSGVDLRFADLDSANLVQSTLVSADLTSIDLDHADLSLADLTDATLTEATLRFSDWTGSTLDGADFSGAQLTNAVGLGQALGQGLYSVQTDFSGTGFDPVVAGWTLIPEPTTAVLLGMGLVLISIRHPVL